MIYIEPVTICVPINVFEPVVAYLPSIVDNLFAWDESVVAIDALNAVCDATLAENEVATEEDKADTLAALAENEVATEELKLPVTLATDALKAVVAAFEAENWVATEPEYVPSKYDCDASNASTLEPIPLPPPPIDDSKLSKRESTDCENGWMLPTKLIASLPSLPSKYNVELPLA